MKTDIRKSKEKITQLEQKLREQKAAYNAAKKKMRTCRWVALGKLYEAALNKTHGKQVFVDMEVLNSFDKGFLKDHHPNIFETIVELDRLCKARASQTTQTS